MKLRKSCILSRPCRPCCGQRVLQRAYSWFACQSWPLSWWSGPCLLVVMSTRADEEKWKQQFWKRRRRKKVEAKLYIELNHADTCHKSYLKLCVLPRRREPQCHEYILCPGQTFAKEEKLAQKTCSISRGADFIIYIFFLHSFVPPLMLCQL